ncbi:Purine catabolism protein PucG [bacterium HR15]|nr:Purine catabolism protein PucG [bacterium HR15]
MRPPESNEARILLGPGPSMVAPRVMDALRRPILGYLDPDLFVVLFEIQIGLRQLFRTENEITFALPGTGMSGAECALANLIEPSDRVLVVSSGFFGDRLVEIARRCGAEVYPVRSQWGRPVEPEDIESLLKQHPRWKLIAMVHAETSTGVHQPVEPIAELARRYEALLVVDAVTSLGGMPVEVDGWGIDICFSASQKCIGAPPGLAPITISPRAWNSIQKRRTACQSWYLDLRLLWDYWSEPHVYHHTTPVSLMYALRAALEMVEQEGLPARYERHHHQAERLWSGLQELRLELLIPPEHRLPMLTVVRIPEGIPDQEFRLRLLREFNIEIGGGLGEWRGQVWRIGLMGHSCLAHNVDLLLSAMNTLLHQYRSA